MKRFASSSCLESCAESGVRVVSVSFRCVFKQVTHAPSPCNNIVNYDVAERDVMN